MRFWLLLGCPDMSSGGEKRMTLAPLRAALVSVMFRIESRYRSMTPKPNFSLGQVKIFTPEPAVTGRCGPRLGAPGRACASLPPRLRCGPSNVPRPHPHVRPAAAPSPPSRLRRRGAGGRFGGGWPALWAAAAPCGYTASCRA